MKTAHTYHRRTGQFIASPTGNEDSNTEYLYTFCGWASTEGKKG